MARRRPVRWIGPVAWVYAVTSTTSDGGGGTKAWFSESWFWYRRASYRPVGSGGVPLGMQWGAGLASSWVQEEYAAITGTGYVETPVGMVTRSQQLGKLATDSIWSLRRPMRKSPPWQATVSIGAPVLLVTTTSPCIVVPVLIVIAG